MVLCAICALITFAHIYRPNLSILHQAQLCGGGMRISPTDAEAAGPPGGGGGGGGNPDSFIAGVSGEPLIPPKIWQNYFADEIDDDNLGDAASWIALNRDYTYTMLGMDGADAFVNRHFADDPALLRRYHSLPNFGMKSDLLRYLVLLVEGGTYTDVDTAALRPIRDWVPRTARHLARAVVGIEFDQRDGGGWVDIPHELQFCQWTIAAAPGHPLFREMAARALAGLAELERRHNATALAALRPSNLEVLNTTGPAAWTDAVFDHLRRAAPERVQSLRNFSYLEEPTLFGDVLVLPVDGFGMGQAHSGSTNDGSIPDAALVKHNFRGRWRG